MFEYSGEDFDTDVQAIDMVEDQQAYTIQMTMLSGGSGSYSLNENITLDGVVIGETVQWLGEDRTLTIKDNTKTLQVDDVLVGASSTASHTIETITDVLTMGNDAMSQNKEFEDKDTSYLDFSEVNPFGEP